MFFVYSAREEKKEESTLNPSQPVTVVGAVRF